MDDPSTGVWSFTHVWLGVTTIAGTIVAFFTKRLVDTVDGKAEKTDLEKLENRFEQLLAAQTAQHTANTTRLDQILIELTRRPHS